MQDISSLLQLIEVHTTSSASPSASMESPVDPAWQSDPRQPTSEFLDVEPSSNPITCVSLPDIAESSTGPSSAAGSQHSLRSDHRNLAVMIPKLRLPASPEQPMDSDNEEPPLHTRESYRQSFHSIPSKPDVHIPKLQLSFVQSNSTATVFQHQQSVPGLDIEPGTPPSGKQTTQTSFATRTTTDSEMLRDLMQVSDAAEVRRTESDQVSEGRGRDARLERSPEFSERLIEGESRSVRGVTADVLKHSKYPTHHPPNAGDPEPRVPVMEPLALCYTAHIISGGEHGHGLSA